MKNTKQILQDLHKKGNPLILYNIWDCGSAKILSELGAKVIGTSSFAIAKSYGFEDGEKIPLNLVIENLDRIVKSVSVPVTLDFESGYGKTAQEIKENAKKILATGVAGLNLEDQIIGENGLYSTAEQCSRINAIRELSDDIFINARTDIFFKNETHDEALINQAIERAIEYKKAGADCFFVPKLKNIQLIKKLCEASPLPVNIVLLETEIKPISKELIDAGVSRISYGTTPYKIFIQDLKNKWEICSKISKL
jgi:2-methylisocitrate lyase-like PEP mutase family enzyme